MITIDDIACAKLAAAGCENPKAVLRDLKLFGHPEKDLSRYLRAKAWELEEAVAIGLGRHPHNLSISVIREKCPEQINLQCKAPPDDLLPTAQLFIDRYELLKRAAFIGDIKSEERGGMIWFKPVDLAAYAQKEWDHYMPSAARALMAATGLDADTEKKSPHASPYADSADSADSGGSNPCAAALGNGAGTVSTPADSADSSAGKGKPGSLPSGVSKGKKGPDACRAYLRVEMKKSSDDPSRLDQKQYRNICKKKFGVSSRPFDIIWKEVATETNCTWAKPGRPLKAA